MDNTKILEKIADEIAKAYNALEEFDKNQGDDADVDNADKINNIRHALLNAMFNTDELVP